jgi:DNA-binding MarR family transcriptional regulator
MEKNGFIEKVWDLPDRRSARLIITPKGEQVLKDTAKPNAELIKRLFSAFSKTDQQTLLSLANLLRDKMKEELHIREVKADREILNRRKVTHFLNKLNGHLN